MIYYTIYYTRYDFVNYLLMKSWNVDSMNSHFIEMKFGRFECLREARLSTHPSCLVVGV